MFKGFYNLTSGMLNQGKYLDVIANNMTNVATAGFKADRYAFSTFDEAIWYQVGNKDKSYVELGMQSFITAPDQLYTDYTQSSFDETGLPLDFGIEGDGFFAVETADGRAYTRNGSFTLDEEGYLCLPGHGRVLGADEQPIRLVTDKIEVNTSGEIYMEGGGYLGRLGVFAFADNAQLEKDAYGLFDAAAADPMAANVKVHHKMVERSNVDWVEQMKDMITAQRAYQSAAEAMKIYDSLMTKATTDVGRL